MRKTSVLLISLSALPAVIARRFVSARTELEEPELHRRDLKNILVLALNGKAENRLEFEDQLVAAIRRPGEKVEPSYAFLFHRKT